MTNQIAGSLKIKVTPVSTDTVNVTVTNINETSLMAQLMPALGTASEETPMILDNDVFSQTLVAPDGAYYGYIRLWVPDRIPEQEILVEFVGIEDWNGRSYDWGGRSYDWGGRSYDWGGRSYDWGGRSYAWGGRSYAWGAPSMSNDGQVSIFPLDNLFGENGNIYLQKLTLPPDIDPWLTPVGQAYRFETEEVYDGQAAILFRYLAKNVPAGYENNIVIYYSADDGVTWEPVFTELDTYRNHASAQVIGTGIYILVTTVEITPALSEGWNLFGFPIQETRPVTQALASIDGKYSTIAHYEADSEKWGIYYPSIEPAFDEFVNTLTHLQYTTNYWLYATEPATLYLAPTLSAQNSNTTNSLNLPPATYYGWAANTSEFTPMLGMEVTAWIDGELCGRSMIELLSGQLAYQIQVSATDPLSKSNMCGSFDKTVIFRIDDQIMSQKPTWDNRDANFQILDANTTHHMYLPLISSN